MFANRVGKARPKELFKGRTTAHYNSTITQQASTSISSHDSDEPLFRVRHKHSFVVCDMSLKEYGTTVRVRMF